MLLFLISDSKEKLQLTIKLNMVRWIRKLSRLDKIGVFLEKLKAEGIINDTQKRYFLMDYEHGSTMEKLILFVQHERKEHVLKFIALLRELHPVVADLIMGTDENEDKAGNLFLAHLSTKCSW